MNVTVSFSGATGSTLSTILGISKDDAEALKTKVKEFQENAVKVLEPGETYVHEGTLS